MSHGCFTIAPPQSLMCACAFVMSVEVWSCAHLRRLARHATCATPWVPYIHLILSHALQLEIVGKKVRSPSSVVLGNQSKNTSPRCRPSQHTPTCLHNRGKRHARNTSRTCLGAIAPARANFAVVFRPRHSEICCQCVANRWI